MKVTVIAPCRNEVDYIDSFLQSVRDQEHSGLDLEIIVADGMSDDGTTARLAVWAARDSAVRILMNPEKIVSTGLNRAIAAANGEIIVRMDIHTAYAPDYVQRCVETLESTGAQCVGGPWLAEGVAPRQRAIAAAFQSRFGSGAAASRIRDYNGPVDTVYLGAWRKPELERLGGFDEEMVRNQDDELCLRITRSGGTVWQSPSIRSVYTPRNSFWALARQFHQYGYWKALVMRKHRLPASPRHLAPLAFVTCVATLLLLAPLSAIASLLLAVTAGAYLAAACASALCVTARPRPSTMMIVAAFAIMHFSYGIGFGRGSADFLILRRGAAGSMKSLTR